MGMSASQARFLCLTARKNNVEFEGQQINQQRTCLSNESASYYSELCNMAVPVPPSIDDFTKVTYTFNDGAMTNTVTSLLFDPNSEDKYMPYHVNYLQQWQDDYSVVPASSSLVMKDGSNYSVGSETLRKMDYPAPSTAPSTFPDNDYFNSLSSDEERYNALKTEEYYTALLREELGTDSENYYVRYVKNNNTGAYVPYFYAESELTNSTYNDRNLASVPCYTIGSTTKTKEVINMQCNVEQDQSGRYVALIFGREEGIRQVEKSVQDGWKQGPLLNEGEMIDNPARAEWEANHPKPGEFDEKYKIEVPETTKTETVVVGQEQIGVEGTGEYNILSISAKSDDTLTAQFLIGSRSCYDLVMDNDQIQCYWHVLAHILTVPDCVADPAFSADSPSEEFVNYYNNGGGIKFNTTLGSTKQITIKDYQITNASICTSGKSPLLIPVRQAVMEGNYTYSDGITYPTLLVVDDIEDYRNIGNKINYEYKGITYTIENDYPIDRDNQDIYNLLSDQYIKTGGGTDAQKLLSNYYYDNGTVKQKSIKQKAIDLYYAMQHNAKDDLDIDWLTLKPLISTFQYDLMHYSLNIVKEEIMKPVYKDITEERTVVVPGYTKYNTQKWQEDVDDWETELNKIPEKIPAEPVYGDKEPNMVKKLVDEPYFEPGKRVQLLTITTTDEEAYKDAMNDYEYQQHAYDHKVQEINAKLKILQLQDKQLELKLKQLDTEENAISTEMDAVKKVISKNVDSSFKTFSA